MRGKLREGTRKGSYLERSTSTSAFSRSLRNFLPLQATSKDTVFNEECLGWPGQCWRVRRARWRGGRPGSGALGEGGHSFRTGREHVPVQLALHLALRRQGEVGLVRLEQLPQVFVGHHACTGAVGGKGGLGKLEGPYLRAEANCSVIMMRGAAASRSWSQWTRVPRALGRRRCSAGEAQNLDQNSAAGLGCVTSTRLFHFFPTPAGQLFALCVFQP